MVIYHYVWKENFIPQNVQMEKGGLCLAKNHNFTWFRKNVSVTYSSPEGKQASLCSQTWKVLFWENGKEISDMLGQDYHSTAFYYNYYTKNSCIVFHSFIIVQ